MSEFPKRFSESKPDEKTKKTSESRPLRLPVRAELPTVGREAAPKDIRAISEALLGKPEKPVVASKPPEAAPTKPKVEAEPVKPADQTHDHEKSPAEITEPSATLTPERPDQTESKPYQAKPHEFEPKSSELYAGELFIRRDDNEPVVDHVVSLREITAEADQQEPEEEQTIDYPVFTPQEQQQQFAHGAEGEHAPAPITPEAGGGGNQPPEPPEAHVLTGEGPEPLPTPVLPAAEAWAPVQPAEVLPPEHPNAYPAAGNVVQNANGERVYSEQELEDARYYAKRSGQNSGLATGLLVGGAYEHFKHKRREKKQAKRFKQQTKQLDKARQDYTYGLQEQTRQKAESNRQLESIERKLKLASQPEKAPATTELAPPGAPEQLNIPKDHRLEVSAWHTIEVDAKTGKPVEAPSFQYGHEYYRERAQETTPTHQRNVATGEVALVAAAVASGISGGKQSGSAAKKSPPPDASSQGPPPSKVDKVKGKAKAALHGAKDSPANGGPIWPLVVTLLVVILCLIFALR